MTVHASLRDTHVITECVDTVWACALQDVLQRQFQDRYPLRLGACKLTQLSLSQ